VTAPGGPSPDRPIRRRTAASPSASPSTSTRTASARTRAPRRPPDLEEARTALLALRQEVGKAVIGRTPW
jgi:hypothetical protein